MLKVGDQPIPGYRIESLLGRGQFGEVWRATSPGGAQVALKFLDLSDRQGVKELRAVQQIKTIRHPHLASVIALWLRNSVGQVLDDKLKLAPCLVDAHLPAGKHLSAVLRREIQQSVILTEHDAT